MLDCPICPGLQALADRHPKTWVRLGIWHGGGTEPDQCQVTISRDSGVITGMGSNPEEAAQDAIRQMMENKD